MLELIKCSKSDLDLKGWMEKHYSKPRGFVGRQLIYKIYHNNICYGAIAAGSATRFLPGRSDFFKPLPPLNNIVNNIFYHVEKRDDSYPLHNFTSLVIKKWRERVFTDWFDQYGDQVFGWETLVELPRTGDLYKKDGWTEVGLTKGYTCKRVSGESTDNWTGRRVWDTKNLRPKRVFMREVE